jgi:hypothetical protein
MKMDIASVGMLDYSSVDETGALMHSDDRLRMNTTVYFGKVVDTFTQTINHLFQKPSQGIGFMAPFNFRDAAIFYGEAYWFFKVR